MPVRRLASVVVVPPISQNRGSSNGQHAAEPAPPSPASPAENMEEEPPLPSPGSPAGPMEEGRPVSPPAESMEEGSDSDTIPYPLSPYSYDPLPSPLREPPVTSPLREPPVPSPSREPEAEAGCSRTLSIRRTTEEEKAEAAIFAEELKEQQKRKEIRKAARKAARKAERKAARKAARRAQRTQARAPTPSPPKGSISPVDEDDESRSFVALNSSASDPDELDLTAPENLPFDFE